MDQPEDVQEQEDFSEEVARYNAAFEYARFKMEIIAKFDTGEALEVFEYLVGSPSDVEKWLNDKIDVHQQHAQEAHTARRENPSEETYDGEDSTITNLDALTDIRAIWRDLLDQVTECFDENTTLQQALVTLDHTL